MFRVTISTPVGALSVWRDTAAAALEKARELQGEGAAQIAITGSDGWPRALVDFEKWISEESPDAETP